MSQAIPEAISARLQYLLEQAIILDKADKGDIRLFDSQSQTLALLVQSGLPDQYLEKVKAVTPFDPTPCGRAIGVGSVVTINNVEEDKGFSKLAATAIAAGFRSVKSVPVYDNREKLVGVLTTHFAEPKYSWERNRLQPVLKELGTLLSELVA